MENNLKICILKMSNLGPVCSSRGPNCACRRSILLREKSALKCAWQQKIKDGFFMGRFCSNFWGMFSTININLVSDDYVCRNKTLCRKQGLEANIQTRVYIEFLLATNTRVEIVLIQLEQNTIMIESFGHGKRLRLG